MITLPRPTREVVPRPTREVVRRHQPVTQSAAQRKIVGQPSPQRAGHDAPPVDSTGQGRASTASASRSTLA
jgi:hypothetical protein